MVLLGLVQRCFRKELAVGRSEVGIAVIGTGQRGFAFARFLVGEEPGARLVAVCDADRNRAGSVARMLGAEGLLLETDWRRVLDNEEVNAVVIATPDHVHEEVVIPAMEADKHIFLEKPMETTLDACGRIARRAKGYGKVFQLGYVLRYAPFYKKLHQLIHSGELGQVVSVEAKELVRYRHGASYARRWHRSSEKSGGLLLTKCCHDLDILNWVSGSRPARVVSFGGTNFFRPNPKLPQLCRDCEEECDFRFDPRDAFVLITPEELEELDSRRMDLCVFNADKDIVDNQSAIIEYENGLRAIFSVTLFSPRETRTCFVSGTKGEVAGDFGRGRLILTRPGSSKEKVISVESYGGGHAGADKNTWRDFIRHILDGTKPQAGAEEGFESALVALAADMSRHSGTAVELGKLREQYLAQ